MEQTKEDIIREIDQLTTRIWHSRGIPTDVEHPMLQAEEMLAKAHEIGYARGVASCMLSLGMGSFIIQHKIPVALEQLNKALELYRELGDARWAANTMLTLSIFHNTLGNSEAALYNALRGIDYYENDPDGDEYDKIMGYYVIGTVYKDIRRYTEAERYYRIAIENKNIDNITWGGRIFAGLSNILTEQGHHEKAIEMSMRGLAIFRGENNTLGESRALNDIGHIYKLKKDYDNALRYFFEGLKIREDNNIKQFIIGSLSEVADVYFLTGNSEEAIRHLKRAEQIADELNQHAKLLKIYRELASICKSCGDFEQAMVYFEKLSDLSAELNNREKESRISTVQSDLVEEKEKEIERLRNVELRNAYDLISEKNKEITDSLLYAKRIQTALLASSRGFDKNFKEHFIFYRPKDIVSGDFYWAAEKGDLFYLAVCDSTGHGVPGAFMSLLNTSFLNEAVNEKGITAPQEIFNYVRERLLESVSQEGGQDGMDGILICLNRKDGSVKYAAANNCPVVMSAGSATSYPCDKMPVGKGEHNRSFTGGEIILKPGDALYLYTDGFADQFGGEKGKKFKQKQLNTLLAGASTLPMRDQQSLLDATLTTWKGQLEQIDDVLVIGVRV